MRRRGNPTATCCGAVAPAVCGTTCCLTCSPCIIPKADLSLSINGGAPTILAYNGTNWSDGTHTLGCSGGNIVLLGGGTWTLTASTCNAFNITFTSGGNTAIASSNAYAAATCCQTFNFGACGGNDDKFQGTVNVYSSNGGTLLFSGNTKVGVTPTTYKAVFPASCSSSTLYITAVSNNSTRYTSFSHTGAITAGGTMTISLTANTGYKCPTACKGPPLKNNLVLTDPDYSTATLTYGATSGPFNTGDGWCGSQTVTSAAACGCAGASVTISYLWGSPSFHVGVTTASPFNLWISYKTLSGCPDDTGAVVFTASFSGPLVPSCSNASDGALSVSATLSAGNTCSGTNLLGKAYATAGTFTITE